MDSKTIMYALKAYYSNAENTEKIILNCALVAASADLVGGAIPGLAIPAVITSRFGAIWVMYGKLCKELGISLKDNTLKILARAAITNIAMNLTGVILGALAGMLIPGASIPVSAIVTFATVYLAGMMFLQLILKMAQKSTDPHMFSDISADEMKKTVSGIKLSKDDLEAAKKVYENNKG
mgnify:FL=1